MLRFNLISTVIRRTCQRRNLLLGGFVAANVLTYKSFCDEDANLFKSNKNGKIENESLHMSLIMDPSITSTEANGEQLECTQIDNLKETEIGVSVKLPFSSTFLLYLWDRISWLSHLFERSMTLMYIYTPVLLTSFMALSEDEKVRNSWWQLFRDSMCRAGPCHIKFAQWISTRPDLFPKYICNHFQDLQSIVNYDTITIPELHELLTLEYGPSWAKKIQLDEIHLNNSNGEQINYPVILGSGCVAQVYKGRALVSTVGDKENVEWIDVAIKVTHPNIRQLIFSDLELMHAVASALEWAIPGARNISLVDSVEEFSSLMINQVNMLNEARNLLTFRRNFRNLNHYNENSKIISTLQYLPPVADDLGEDLNQSSSTSDQGQSSSETSSNALSLPYLDNSYMKVAIQKLLQIGWVREIVTKYLLPSEAPMGEQVDLYNIYFPEPLLDFTTNTILIETYESGTLLRDYLKIANTPQKKRVGKAGLNGIFKMVFFDNFIHADLHGGNIIVNKNSDSDFRLCFIDCGITGELNQSDQRNLIDLFKAVIENNGYQVGLLMAERSRFPTKIPQDHKEKFAQEMGMIINHIHSVGLRPDKININELLSTVLMLCFKYQVKLESRYATILIAMGIVEGLGRELDPNINIMANATPFVMKASIDQMLAKGP